MADLTGDIEIDSDEEDREAATPRWRMTDARRRALMKARDNGFVMAAGGFGGVMQPVEEVIMSRQFDRASVIDNLINAGFLTYGEHFNVHVITEAGIEALRSSKIHTGPRPADEDEL